MTNQNKNFKFFLIFYILAYFKPYRFQNKSIGFLNLVQLQFVLRRFEVLRQFLCVMNYFASSTATDELGIGGVSGTLAGGDAATGAAAAYAGETYNRQLHQKEIDILKDEKVIKEYAEEKGITPEEAEKQLTKAGVAMVDGTWNKKFGDDASFASAKEYLLAQDPEGEAFIEKDLAVYNNFNNSGEVFKTNIDFYGKNLDSVDLFVIEDDKNDPYGAVAYRRNDNEELDRFGKFVTRGYNEENQQEVSIAAGVHSYIVAKKTSSTTGKHYNAMLLNGGGFVPTEDKNTLHGTNKANGIYVHLLNSYAKTIKGTKSEGCLGVPATTKNPKENFDSFNEPFANNNNKKGDIVLIRLEDNNVKK